MMISRYGIFCEVAAAKSFTKVSKKIGYTKSAVSQNIKALETQLGTKLFIRSREGITLTSDGIEYFAYLKSIYNAEISLEKKQQEMRGLENSVVTIGGFTSVSRNILPSLMKNFKKVYPKVRFALKQGEYTSIGEWVKQGEVDFGFIISDAVSDVFTKYLYADEMVAVLPENHRLAKNEILSLKELSKEPFILLDEGNYSIPLKAFEKKGLSPKIEYKVYDDYSILEMIRRRLGISIIYEKVLIGNEKGLIIKKIKEKPTRCVSLAWKSRDTMSFASRKFMDYITEYFNK